MYKQATIEQVAERIGLSNEATRNMLEAGWVYVETLGKPPRWERAGESHAIH